MRKIIVTLILIALLIIPAAVAQAATSALVTVYATPSYMSISIAPDTFTFSGVIVANSLVYAGTDSTTPPLNDPLEDSDCPFKVTNASTVNIKVTANTTDWTGGVAWICSDTAGNGPDTFGLKAGVNGTAVAGMVAVPKTVTVDLKATTAYPGEDFSFEMSLLAPTTFSDGDTKTGAVQLTATTP